MKITKGRLQESINEEVSRLRLAENSYHDVEPDSAPSGPNSQLPQELVQSWAKEIHKFIGRQWSADSDFNSVRAEKPAIIAALKQVANEMWNDEGPEPYHEARVTHDGSSLPDAVEPNEHGDTSVPTFDINKVHNKYAKAKHSIEEILNELRDDLDVLGANEQEVNGQMILTRLVARIQKDMEGGFIGEPA